MLAWLIDTDINMSFQVSPAGIGTLTIHNMSTTPNGSAPQESAQTLSVVDGATTLESVNASTLGNLTFSYHPDGGSSKPAEGKVRITTATAISAPGTIYINEPTTVEITVTHPATGAAISGVSIALDLGKALANTVLSKIPVAKNTGTDGKVQFSITSEASGNVTIYIKGGTDRSNPFVIESKARKIMTLTVSSPAVNEGETFTVSAKSGGSLITDATVSFAFNGVTYTTDTGTKELTAPTIVSSSADSLDYTVTGNADGYTIDATVTIKVLNVPNLYISTDSEVASGQKFIILVEGDDGSKVGISVTFNAETKVSGPSGAEFTAPSVSTDTDYTITATKDGYVAATDITITVKATPGFELLTLIVAIGVAFILLRRRRR